MPLTSSVGLLMPLSPGPLLVPFLNPALADPVIQTALLALQVGLVLFSLYLFRLLPFMPHV